MQQVDLKLSSPTFHIGPKQHSEDKSISDSAANISHPDVLPTSRDDDQIMAGLF